VNEPDYRQQQAIEEHLMSDLALVQRIERGLATAEDARIVAKLLGITTEKLYERA
jgi:NADH:ubiquinone oxidoreductase subunit E